MQTIGIILTFIVGIEHIGICFLEIFGKPATQAKAFDMDINFVKQRAAKISIGQPRYLQRHAWSSFNFSLFCFQSSSSIHSLGIVTGFNCRCSYFWGIYCN